MTRNKVPHAKGRFKGKKEPKHPLKRVTRSKTAMGKWLKEIEDMKMYPPAQVKEGSYSLLPHTVDYDPCISALDSRVYSYLSHRAGLERSAMVHGINSRKLGTDIGISHNAAIYSLKVLVARKHIKKRLDLGKESYELLSKIYDKWRH